VKAVVFGAGGVGLGFLGELLTRSGYVPAFVDIDQQVVRALNRYGNYVFTKVGDGIQSVRVEGVEAINPEETAGRERLAATLAEAQVVFTAAGAGALPTLGSILAHTLQATQFSRPRLNIFCCENHRNAAAALRQATQQALGENAQLINNLRFVNTVVARMCQRLTAADCDLPAITPQSDIIIVGEEYDLLPVDGGATVEPRPDIAGLQYLSSDEFEAWDKRKLFAHNGIHALIAVLGELRGYCYFYEAGEDPEIDAVARGAMWQEVGAALVDEYPRWFSSESYETFARDLYARIVSHDFADVISRGIRRSLRMIRADDGRLTRAAQFVANHGILPYRLCLGIAGVLWLNDIPADRVTGTLYGADSNLSETVVQLIVRAYEVIGQWQTERSVSLLDFGQSD